jgi:hypothetical protein
MISSFTHNNNNPAQVLRELVTISPGSGFSFLMPSLGRAAQDQPVPCLCDVCKDTGWVLFYGDVDAPCTNCGLGVA